MCYLLCAANVPASAKPGFTRQSILRSSTQSASTGPSLPPVMQNGCENAEAGDVPPQKPHAGMTYYRYVSYLLCCVCVHFVGFSFLLFVLVFSLLTPTVVMSE